ncbi:MAG: YfhO family protein [Cyanobacteria bacterium SZAS LIN-3]|nr:YfhO family protein [Cyanobacteria bacterium SZAS LIN-3]
MADTLGKNIKTLVFFVFCALIFFGPKLAQGYVLAPEDDFVQNYPAFASPVQEWTPLLLTGFPVLADPQVQSFYPLAWLCRALPLGLFGPGLTANFNLYIILAYVLAAFFAAALGRKLTGSFYAGLLAGLVYGFSGYLISELKHVQVLHTALWLPALLYLLEALREAVATGGAGVRARFISMLLCFVVALSIFAGHPQTALYCFACAFAYGLMLAWRTAHRWIFLLFQTSGFATGVALAAIQLLPSIHLASFSARAAFTFKDFIIGQVEPLQMLGFLFPYMLGGAYGTIGDLPFSEQGAPPGLMFFGFGPVLLAVVAILAANRLRLEQSSNTDTEASSAGDHLSVQRLSFFFFLTLSVAMIAMGNHTVFGRLAYHLPFFGQFRGLYRILVLCALPVSMLSAYGLAQLEKDYCGENPQPEPLNIMFGRLGPIKHFFLFLYLVCAGLSYPFLLGTVPLLFFNFRFKRLPWLYKPLSSRRQWILLAASFLALASYGWNAEWSKASPLATDFAPPAVAARYGEETNKSHTRIFTIKGIEGERDQLPPNLSRLWGVPSATGYEPLVSLRLSRLLGIAEGGFMQPPWRIVGVNRALDMVSVKYLFAPWGAFAEHAFDADAKRKWKLVQAADKTLIYENLDVLPRFYLVPGERDLSAESIFQTITTGKYPDGKLFDPRSTVLLESSEDKPGAEVSPAAVSDFQARARIENYTLADDRLTFDVRLPDRGYFVLTDLYDQGWQLKLDGASVPTYISRANYVQRAVQLEAGLHHLVMTYDTPLILIGETISLGALGLWFVISIDCLRLIVSRPKNPVLAGYFKKGD